jgi:hypothetical protein
LTEEQVRIEEEILALKASQEEEKESIKSHYESLLLETKTSEQVFNLIVTKKNHSVVTHSSPHFYL